MSEKDYYYLYQKYKNKYLNLKGGSQQLPTELNGVIISNLSSIEIIKTCGIHKNLCNNINWRDLLKDRYNIVDYEINEQQPYPIICNNIENIDQKNICRKFYYITREFQETLNRIRENGLRLHNVSDELKNNPEIILAAVEQDSNLLEFASERLKDNYNIVLAGLKNRGIALEFASERLKDN